jgi:hypothetical protein
LSKNEVFDADHPPTLRSSALGEGDTIIGEREVGANDVVLVERLKAGGGWMLAGWVSWLSSEAELRRWSLSRS